MVISALQLTPASGGVDLIGLEFVRNPSPSVADYTGRDQRSVRHALGSERETKVNPLTAAASSEDAERTKIAISIADPTNRRLVEGVAVQLSLEPIFVDAQHLMEVELLASIALLVADEPIARHFRELETQVDHAGVAIQPALVAVLPEGTSVQALLPRKDDQQSYDGLLVLPQFPSVILAQLSIILYAHRANVRRYESALEELVLNRNIFRSVTSGISVASATEPDFPLIYVNPAFEVISGYSLEDIQGKNCRFLQGKEHDQPGLVLVREALREKRETTAILKNYKKDGTPFWNELALSPIFDKEGTLTYFVGIQNDVSARVAFEEALRESEKLATAGRLAATIAHEINNPLEAVTNLIYLAKTEEASVTVRSYLDQAEDELRRVSLLTTQSLRFYKQSSRPQATRPVDLVTSVLDVYSVKITNWAIRVERRDQSCDSIVCLESEIRQVLSNLVRNAMDAMRGTGGRLLVRVQEAHNWKTEVRGVSITVADTGHGMTAETREKLFQAFYTTKGLSGTGLGLWVSQEIVARHHGTLRVRSRRTSGQSGTVFTLFLPYQAVMPR